MNPNANPFFQTAQQSTLPLLSLAGFALMTACAGDPSQPAQTHPSSVKAKTGELALAKIEDQNTVIQTNDDDGKDYALTSEIVAGRSANDYKVMLKWRWKAGFEGAFSIDRKSPEGVITHNLVSNSTHSFTDSISDTHFGKQNYTYTLNALDHFTGDHVFPPFEVRVPVDLHLDHSISLSDLARVKHIPLQAQHFRLDIYDRIFMDDGVFLDTENQDFELIAKEIICTDAKGCTIGNFQENIQPAVLGSNGLNGPPLTVSVVIAQGKLTLLSRGQPGGAGTQGAVGGVGRTGDAGALIKQCSNSLNPMAPQEPLTFHVGTQGGKGGVGGRGMPGMKGGDAGKIIFAYQKPKPGFVIEALAIAGPGGAGGEGGSGGPGGQPGTTTHNKCPVLYVIPALVKPDPVAAPGPQGDPGYPGAPGVAGSSPSVCYQDDSLNRGCIY